MRLDERSFDGPKHAQDKGSLPPALWALAVCAFAVGTGEFVVAGLLLNIAGDLHVSTSHAGLLVSGYALGVVAGAPLAILLTRRLPRKQTLLALMGVFVTGNLLCAIPSSYATLMAARVMTGLAHAAFFGMGSVIAAEVVPAGRRASAIAVMFTGVTLANVLGVPHPASVRSGVCRWKRTGWRARRSAADGFLIGHPLIASDRFGSLHCKRRLSPGYPHNSVPIRRDRVRHRPWTADAGC